jgi:hypothetical protein
VDDSNFSKSQQKETITHINRRNLLTRIGVAGLAVPAVVYAGAYLRSHPGKLLRACLIGVIFNHLPALKNWNTSVLKDLEIRP